MTHIVDQDTFYSTIGQKIRERRSERGLTQAQLAKLLSLSRTSVTNIESGRQKLLVHTLVQIASVLNMEANALLPNVTTSEKTITNEALLEELSASDRQFISQIVTIGPDENIR
jgi:transcriptional regulator with XRE-family HTH domain